MLATALLVFAVTWAAPASFADTGQGGSLIPEGMRAIRTPDDCAIILVSDPTNGAGTGVGWLGVGGAIACNADNSIIVWSGGSTPPTPQPPLRAPIPFPQPPSVAPTPPSQQFLWPEGVEDARPFDLDNSIILRGDNR